MKYLSLMALVLLVVCSSCSEYNYLSEVYPEHYSAGYGTKERPANQYPHEVIDQLPSDFKMAHFHNELSSFVIDSVRYQEQKLGVNTLDYKYDRKTKKQLRAYKRDANVFIPSNHPHLVFMYPKNIEFLSNLDETTVLKKASQYIEYRNTIEGLDATLLDFSEKESIDSTLMVRFTAELDSVEQVALELERDSIFFEMMNETLGTELEFQELLLEDLLRKNQMVGGSSLLLGAAILGNEGREDIFEETYEKLAPIANAPYCSEHENNYSSLHIITAKKLKVLQSFIYNPVKLSENFSSAEFSADDISRVRSWIKDTERNLVKIKQGTQNPVQMMEDYEDNPLNLFHLFGGAVSLETADIPFSHLDETENSKADLTDYELFVRIAEKAGFYIYASDPAHPRFVQNGLHLVATDFQNNDFKTGTLITTKFASDWMLNADAVLDYNIEKQEYMIVEKQRLIQKKEQMLADMTIKLEQLLVNSAAQKELTKEKSSVNSSVKSNLQAQKSLIEGKREQIRNLENEIFHKQKRDNDKLKNKLDEFGKELEILQKKLVNILS